MARLGILGVLVATILLGACDGALATQPPQEPEGPPVVQCLGIPALTCNEHAAGIGPSGSGARPVAIRITCTRAPCTPQQGEASVEIVYADGTRSSSGFGWVQAAPGIVKPVPPAPVQPPVEPVCVRIDLETCQRMAEEQTGGDIESITVTCDAVRTPERGSGRTTVRYADGTTTELLDLRGAGRRLSRGRPLQSAG